MAKKIAVVTGYAGFIGSTFTEKLLEDGWYVYCIDKINYVSNTLRADMVNKKYYQNMQWIAADICNIDWLPECDVIFNLAAESDVDVGNQSAVDFVRSNIEGVRNLLSIIQKEF